MLRPWAIRVKVQTTLEDAMYYPTAIVVAAALVAGAIVFGNTTPAERAG